jgi:hypothetical protein
MICCRFRLDEYRRVGRIPSGIVVAPFYLANSKSDATLVGAFRTTNKTRR